MKKTDRFLTVAEVSGNTIFRSVGKVLQYNSDGETVGRDLRLF
jgi:hypothetical protein